MWWSLFKKEWQESLPRFYIILGTATAAYIFMFIFIERNTPIFFVLGFGVIALHVFYLFASWLISFAREWRNKTHYSWLNLPAPGWVLLTTKTAAGFAQFALSLLYAMITAYVILSYTINLTSTEGAAFYNDENMFALVQQLYLELSPWIFLGISHGAVQLGLAAVFIFLMSKIIRPFGWLIGIGLTIAWMLITSFVENLFVFETLTQVVPLINVENIVSNAVNTIGIGNATLAIENGSSFFLGEVIYYGLIYIFLFWLFSFLLDRYVEA